MFFTLLLSTLLTGCSGKSGESKASFDIKLAGLTSIQQFSGGGALLFGSSLETGNHFSRRIDNVGGETLAMDLPNGLWNFSIIMWDGDHDRDGIFSDALIPLTGKVRCGGVEGVLLNGSEVTVSLSANNANCLSPVFGGGQIDDGTGTGTLKFNDISFRQCRGGVATETDPLATNCDFENKGFYGSIRLMVAPFQEGPGLPNNVDIGAAIEGPCINTLVGSSPDINDYAFIDGSSAIPNIPTGNPAGNSRNRTFIRGFYDSNCGGARGFTDIPFVGSLVGQVGPLAKFFPGGTNPTMLLGTPDALACAGIRGGLVTDFSIEISGSTPIYGICNEAQFDLIAPDFQTGAAYQNADFILMNDINYFAGQDISPTNPPSVASFSMIGNDIGTNPASSQPYNGTFYGNNKIITGLSIDIEDSAGPISDVGFVRRLAGTVKNLTFILPEVMSDEYEDHKRIGVVAGTVSGGTIEDVSIIYGSAEGREEVGLFAGRIEASSNLTFLDSIDSSVEGMRFVGGITGYADASNISFTEFEGVVELDSNSHDFGFCADPSESYFGGCTTNLSFEGFGGIAGKTVNSNISKSSSKGLILGGTDNGGLVGFADWGSISDSYSVMTVLGSKVLEATRPTADGGDGTLQGNTGGVLGVSGGGTGPTIDRVFHSIGTVANPKSDPARVNSDYGFEAIAVGGTGATTAAAVTPTLAEYNNLRSSSFMDPLGFTVANGWRMDDDTYDLPILDWEAPRECSGKFATQYAGGDGSPGNPFLICSAQQFVNMSNDLDQGFHFRLERPIDLVGTGTAYDGVVPNAGNAGKEFQGVFDGNNRFINNAFVTWTGAGTGPIGLFQEIGVNGVVKNINVIGKAVSSVVAGKPQGLVAGINRGLIDRGVVFGSIESTATSGAAHTGGVVGINEGVLAGVLSLARVQAHYEGGGLVGTNKGGLIIYSQSSGEVSPSRNDRVAVRLGGIVGGNIPFNGTKNFFDEVNGEDFSYNGSVIQSSFEGRLTTKYGPAVLDKMVFVNSGLIAGYNDGSIEDVQSYGSLDMNVGTDPTLSSTNVDATATPTFTADQIAIIGTASAATALDGSINESWAVGDLVYKMGTNIPVRIPGPHGINTAALTVGTDSVAPFFNVGFAVGENGGSGVINNAFIGGNSQASGGNYYSTRFGNYVGFSANAVPITNSFYTGELVYPGSNNYLLDDLSNKFLDRNAGTGGRLLVYVDDATFDGSTTINLNSATDFNTYGLGGTEKVRLGNYNYFLGGAPGTTSVAVSIPGVFDTALGELWVPDDVDFNTTNYADFFSINLGWDVGDWDLGSVWEEESSGGGYSVYLVRPEQYAEHPEILDYIDLVNGGAPSSTGNTLSPNLISLNVTNGPAAGGTTFTITGTNLVGIQSVSVGPYLCTTFTETSETSLDCTTDVGVAGTYDVIVVNDFGETGTLPSGFTYNP